LRRKMVVRYLDGRVAKGFSPDFIPTGDRFQLMDRLTGDVEEILCAELKAVFFVQSFDGDADRRQRDDIERVGLGRKIRVHFRDGETFTGFSASFRPDLAAFVVYPGDPDNNCLQAVILRHSVARVEGL
jgi:Family of unknown function (DUF6982)